MALPLEPLSCGVDAWCGFRFPADSLIHLVGLGAQVGRELADVVIVALHPVDGALDRFGEVLT